jgi:putative glutamine amidotransferase
MADGLGTHGLAAAADGFAAAAPVVLAAGIWDRERGVSYLPDSYSAAILAAGGLPLIRPPRAASAGQIAGLLDRADALLIPGGADFDTERLGLGPVHPRARPVPAAQQDADVALVTAALERELPVLGICYGMQLLGLVGGGRLHQHLPDDAPGTVAHQGAGGGDTQHEVEVLAGTGTAAALGLPGGGRVRICSAHHQALASAGPGWRVSARDADGLVEAIERPGPALTIGVQWHPERGELLSGLFAALVAAGQERAARVGAQRGAAPTRDAALPETALPESALGGREGA